MKTFNRKSSREKRKKEWEREQCYPYLLGTTLVTKHNMLVRCEKPTKTNLRPQLTFSKQSVFVEEEVARTKI
jgi:hypothetical protein